MKQPLSVIIIARNPKTHQEVHTRFDATTGFPRLRLLGIFLRAVFSV